MTRYNMNGRSFILEEVVDDKVLTRGERTRQAILDSAKRLFLSSGYNGTSMRQIAQGADIALGGIYNHFSGKEDIFRSLLEERSPFGLIIAALDELDEQSGPAMIRDAFARLEAILLQNLDFFGLVMIDAQEFNGRMVRRLINQVMPTFMRFAQRLHSAGGMRQDLSPFVMLRAFAILMFGYTITQAIGFGGEQIDIVTLPEVQGIDWQPALVDVFLHGIAAAEDDR